jgi:hypothetical protein
MVLQSFIIVINLIIILLRVLVGAAELVGARLVDGVEPLPPPAQSTKVNKSQQWPRGTDFSQLQCRD